MSRVGWKMWAICALQFWPLGAAADGFALKQSVQAGRPLRPLEITLSGQAEATLDAGGTRRAIPARGVRSATIEALRVADDAAVTIVRAVAENGEWIVVLGGPTGKELLLAERSDLHGDPGERRALAISRDKLPERDASAISVGTRHEGLSLCGSGQPWLLDRREIDAKTLRFVPRAQRPRAGGELAHAAPAAVAQPSQAKLHLLTARSSSQLDPLTGTPQIPQALTDGARETTWTAGPGAVALLRWSKRALKIERFELELTGRKGPTTVTFYLDGGAFDVALPKPGAGLDRFSFTPPAPSESACVALANDGREALKVADLVALTRVDAAGAAEGLIAELIQDGPEAALAGELLAELGEPAAPGLAARFDELSTRGKRRALKTLATALMVPDVQSRVLEAARSEDDALRQAGLATLAHAGEAGARALRALALETSVSGDAALRVLAAPDRDELPALLAALAAPGGPDRPPLRRALIASARRNPERFEAAVAPLLTDSPGASARVTLALIAAAAERPELGRALAEGALDARDFPDRYRLCLAAGQVARSIKLDAWLAQQVIQAEEWMVREAAYDALRARNSPEAARLVGKMAGDPYPRVRAAASPVLAAAGQRAPLVQLAHKDPWPLVRVAAIRALAGLPDSQRPLAQSLEDASRNVRAAAIDGLAAQKARHLWPEIAQRLVKEDEWPVVKAAAIHFASQLCVVEAREPLAVSARRALRPDATEEDRVLGFEALRALHDLGGDAAEDAQRMVTRDGAPPQLKAAVAQQGPSRCQEKAAAASR